MKYFTDVSQIPNSARATQLNFLQMPKENMRFCELSTGFRFAGAGRTAWGKVVGGRGPEDTIKNRNG